MEGCPIELTLFNEAYERHKRALTEQALSRLRPIYSAEELRVLRIDGIERDVLALRSGRGFVNRDILETVLGNLLECVAPGSHNAPHPECRKQELREAVGEIVDQLYAMIAQSFLAVGDDRDVEERALRTAFALLWNLPRFKERALWNRFASLKDPAVWDAYLLNGVISLDRLATLNLPQQIDRAIVADSFLPYQEFLEERELAGAFEYQMQLVMSTYPGWRILFYHDVAHALTQQGPPEDGPNLHRQPVPLLPRAITELCGRYYQADLHPEARIGCANFLDHPHRGITAGQTGMIGSGCVIYPCTLGGLSVRVQQRHPLIGDFVQIGTDTSILGPVHVKDHCTIGTNTEIYGFVQIAEGCRIGSSVVIGTVRTESGRPGTIYVGRNVQIGDGTIIENTSPHDLVIPDKLEIPARSHVANDENGNPRFIS